VTAYLLAMAASAGVAFVTTPLVRRLSILVGAVAQPGDRKVHRRPTPTMGGVAIFLGVLAGLAAAWRLPFFDELFRGTSEPVAALIAGAAVLAIGVVDDIRGISAPAKLAGQVLAAGLLVLAGVQLLFFWFPGMGILVLSSDLAVPLTVLWVVGIVNAVNLIDGLDGLAAGMVAIASLAFFGYIYVVPGVTYGDASSAALLVAVTAGGALGFLPWNFHPARIFMGDSGAMLLGLLLAVATILGVGRNPFPPGAGDIAGISIPILVPLLVLFVPFLDVSFAIVRRVRRGRSLASADKEHIHHRLLDIGHTHRQAVLLMYLWSALISGSALAVALIDGRARSGIVVGTAVLIFAATAVPRVRAAYGLARERKNGRLAEGPPGPARP
jgi:UDP-GlcNAc:undecaprenyl-phosphate GlcNAc-1-phosphate transferase